MISDWQHIDDEECRRATSAMELVGKRWTSGVLLAATRGAERFTEFMAMIPGLSDRLLTLRLGELQAAGLMEREVIPSTPVQVRYHLTDRGRDLMESLAPLVQYGQRWADRHEPQPQ
ncbi:helix-turn-helix transcriptional regulator [Streptomyces sp. NBC_01476]|uniref:winged helix-turn-helix transcriptional regulator n=1 Tax=Streptomyces sp. NBC_01476 TaxID=2903881 RepID=UPI002E3057AD|nr:helix-turn-helix domain-containing protein [Streptomyces sp. NBC_01476]